MKMELASSESRSCASDFALERLLHGELAGLPAEALRGHLRQCRSCAARLDALEVPAPSLDLDRVWREGVRPSPARRAPLWAAGAVAAAAVVALFFWRTQEATTILKGSPWALTVIARTADGAVRRVAPGAPLRAGDRLRFEVATSWPGGQVAIVSLDARGKVSLLYPTGDATAVVPGGARTLLDGAVELDDSVGAERLVLVACRHPMETAAITEAARVALSRAGGDPRAVAGLGLGCHEETFWLTKVAR
jgi:hypothetical protein